MREWRAITPASGLQLLPPGRASEAVKRAIGAALDFQPVGGCALWLALKRGAAGKGQVSACSQWPWLPQDEVDGLQRCPGATSKATVAPLSRGRRARVARLKAARAELRQGPAWKDDDALKVTCDEHVAFSRRHFSGQVAANPSPSLPPAERSAAEGAAGSAPPPSEPRKLLAAPTCAPPSKEAVYAIPPANDSVGSNAKESAELAASHSPFESAGGAAPSALLGADPQLSLLHGGRQVAPAVKLKMIPSDAIGGSPLQASDLSASATRGELGSPPSRGALSAAPGSAAAMTTQGFDKHGIEDDFYSLTSLRGESRLCDPSCRSATRAPARVAGRASQVTQVVA